jgi:hypothetical protein
MDRERFARLVELMAAMAGGRVEAAFALRDEFAGSLRHAVRRALRARRVDLPAAEVEELVCDAALALFEHAGAWRPGGGALPWVWAQHRIVNVVDRHLGTFTDELDDDRMARWDTAVAERAPRAAAGAEPPSFEVLEALAQRDPRLQALADALMEVATPRDREMWLEMRVQEVMGDPAPAASVGRGHGVSADAARQQRHRVGLRLRDLVSRDERFADLAELACVA